jgi:hypothetical protein
MKKFDTNNCNTQTLTKKNISYKCVYWNMNTNDWSDVGCVYESLVMNQNVTYHKCSCNHTTNFGLLMVNINKKKIYDLEFLFFHFKLIIKLLNLS